MALVRFDKEAFIQSLEVGLCSYVMQQFEKKLETRFNTLVDEIYAELQEDLPDKIKAKILEAFSVERMGSDIRIEVDLKGRD